MVKQPDYETYLKSAAWSTVRARLFAKRGRSCEACCGSQRLHVHHMTYARLGHERNSDLAILCEACHSMVHAYAKNHGLDLREATRTVIKSISAVGKSATKELAKKRLQAERKISHQHEWKLQPADPLSRVDMPKFRCTVCRAPAVASSRRLITGEFSGSNPGEAA